MKIMTSNIWGDYFGNPVTIREDQLYSVYTKYNPDILGFQEVTKSWYNSNMFKQLMLNYDFVGTELSNNTNYVPLVYKKELRLLAKGYERLIDTIDISKAITWAVLETQKNTIFAVCNTHFWYKTGFPEHDAERLKNAQQLSALMKYLADRYACPVFAFGDMNCVLSSDVFKVYAANNIKHLNILAERYSEVCSHHGNPVCGEDGKYHGSRTSNDQTFSIDHMVGLGDGFRVLEYKVVEDQNALDATDHSPVYVDIEFNE